MVTPKVTKARKVTYLGVPATIWEVRTAGPNSCRVRLTRWIEDAVGQPVPHPKGTAVLTHMDGDPMKDGYQVLAEKVIAANEYTRDEDLNLIASLMLVR